MRNVKCELQRGFPEGDKTLRAVLSVFFLVASLVARLAIRLSGRLSAGLLVLGLCACLSTYLLAFLSASLHDFQPPAWPTA